MTAAVLDAPRQRSGGDARGSAADRRRRKLWLLDIYRADVSVLIIRDTRGVLPTRAQEWNASRPLPCSGPIWEYEIAPAVRCFHCGVLLTFETVTVDRIIPGCKGGTYRRNNIRPACEFHNKSLGGAMAGTTKRKARRK